MTLSMWSTRTNVRAKETHRDHAHASTDTTSVSRAHSWMYLSELMLRKENIYSRFAQIQLRIKNGEQEFPEPSSHYKHEAKGVSFLFFYFLKNKIELSSLFRPTTDTAD